MGRCQHCSSVPYLSTLLQDSIMSKHQKCSDYSHWSSLTRVPRPDSSVERKQQSFVSCLLHILQSLQIKWGCRKMIIFEFFYYSNCGLRGFLQPLFIYDSEIVSFSEQFCLRWHHLKIRIILYILLSETRSVSCVENVCDSCEFSDKFWTNSDKQEEHN